MKIAICGGTFDPFHRGHLDPVLSIRDAMSWDRIVFMPAYVQPFKQGRETASGYHRHAMAVLATSGRDEVFVSTQELERGAVSYTVDTLQQVRNDFPGATIDWVIGDDNVAQLLEWKSIDTIFSLANFTVLRRSGSDGDEIGLPPQLAARVATAERRSTHGAIVFAANDRVTVSSTEIRKRAGSGQPIDGLVDAQVSRYIHHYGLYRKGQA
jgi:nicotinate-nucleotide adenylyltransferase